MDTLTNTQLKDMNFHQIMVRICDEFSLTHPQMMQLRQKLERVYQSQFPWTAGTPQPVAVEALARVAYRQLAGGKTLADVTGMKAGKLLKQARKPVRQTVMEQD